MGPSMGRRHLWDALAAAVLCAFPALAQEPWPEPEGPVEIRDEHVLAQNRLTLPPIGPDTVPRGRWSLRLGLLWCNSFGWVQDVPGETPTDRRFLIDAETRTLDLNVARGVGENAQVTLRVPLRWRGGALPAGPTATSTRTFPTPPSRPPLSLQ